jgi:hypothetical protein
VIKLGPGEEKEAGTGACGLTVVSVRSIVPTGLLQIKTDQDYFEAVEHGCGNQCSVSSPSAVDIRHDLVELVLSYRETGERQSESNVRLTGDKDDSCCTAQERTCRAACLWGAEDDLAFVRTSNLWITGPTFFVAKKTHKH